MMTKFEDRLFHELMRDHGTELSAQQAARKTRAIARPVWLSSGVIAAAGASAVGLVMFGSGATPAFAVTQNDNGTATIALHQMSGITGANAKLHSLGDNVIIVPVRPGCEPISSLPLPPGSGHVSGSGSENVETGAITVNVTGLPAGDIVVVAASHKRNTYQMATVVTTPPAPSCVSLPATPSGPGPTQSSGSGTTTG
jgi:hypothetical protein